MNRVMEKVVLFAVGSYNPITIMHLRMFELGKDYFRRTGGASVIGGILSPVNDKYPKQGLLAATHRLEMTRLAAYTSLEHWVKVSPWETIETSDWTRTCNSLLYHQSKINEVLDGKLSERPSWIPDGDEFNSLIETSNTNVNSAVKLMLLCGADVLESFNIPNLWSDEHMEMIPRDFGIVVITRGDQDPMASIERNQMLKKHQKNIIIVDEKVKNEISSTKIREAVKNGDSIRYLVPDPVVNYIEEHRLYR